MYNVRVHVPAAKYFMCTTYTYMYVYTKDICTNTLAKKLYNIIIEEGHPHQHPIIIMQPVYIEVLHL